MEKVQAQINALIELQGLDAQLYRLCEEKSEKPAEKEDLEQAFEEKKEGLKLKEGELKTLQLARKEREIDLETKEKEIKKYQTQLLQIKTNKEYMSLQKEITGLKADNAVLEDEILSSMEKIDKVKDEIQAEKEQLAGEEKNLKEQIQRIDQEVKAINEKIAGLEKERNQHCANIEKVLLARYERVLKAKSGLALVPIAGESCGGCHRVLPPQVISEARMKEKVITCDSCARLLYWAG